MKNYIGKIGRLVEHLDYQIPVT